MEQTKRIRTVSLLLVLLTVVRWVYAQGARQHAWTVLNTGLADKNSGERAIAVRVLGLMTNDPQSPELAMQALGDPKPEVRAAEYWHVDCGGIGAVLERSRRFAVAPR